METVSVILFLDKQEKSWSTMQVIFVHPCTKAKKPKIHQHGEIKCCIHIQCNFIHDFPIHTTTKMTFQFILLQKILKELFLVKLSLNDLI